MSNPGIPDLLAAGLLPQKLALNMGFQSPVRIAGCIVLDMCQHIGSFPMWFMQERLESTIDCSGWISARIGSSQHGWGSQKEMQDCFLQGEGRCHATPGPGKELCPQVIEDRSAVQKHHGT